MYRAAISVRHDGALKRTRTKIFTFEKKLLLENDITQMLVKQLKLYSVMCFFIIPKFKAALIFNFFFIHNIYKSSSVVQLSREAIGQYVLVYLLDRSTQTIARAVTLR